MEARTIRPVASPVITAFHDTVLAGLPDDLQPSLRAAAGGGREPREMHRALMLATRAGRDWAGSALATLRPGDENRLERLPILDKPEDGYHQLQPAAHQERRAALQFTPDEPALELTNAAYELGEALAELSTEASYAQNTPDFEAVGRCGGRVLLIASSVRGNPLWVVEQANEMLKDLIALRGWVNQLGPRFDF
jgi:hypothetical protein